MNRRHLLLKFSALATAASVLAACSGPYTISADVSTYGAWPSARTGASYAFERLPSQQQSQRQAALEEAAKAALAKAGFKPAADTKSADILVSLGARVSRTEASPWDDPLWWRWHGNVNYWRYGPMWRPSAFGYGLLDRRYDRQIALLLRDRVSNAPLYEAHASNESATMGDEGLLAALFQAALADFPAVKPEEHRVSVQIMR